MKIGGKNIVTDFEMATHDSIAWTIDRRWNHVTEHKGVQALICTSSWQQLKTMFIPATFRHVIAPGIEPVKVETKSQGEAVTVCWAGDPVDGTFTMLLSVMAGVKANSGKKFHLTACLTDDPGPVAMEMLDRETTTLLIKPSREQVIQTMIASKIFAHPAMSWESHNAELVTAMSAGCLVVAPKHSGFPEMAGSTGFLTPHSLHNAAYGAAFASVLLEVMDLAQSDTYPPFWQRQKQHVDWISGHERENFSWREFLGFIEFASTNGMYGSAS